MSSEAEGGSTRFVWPPVATPIEPAAPTSPTDDAIASPARGVSRFDRWLRAVETELLGVRRLGLDELVRRRPWMPESPKAWCWRCGGDIGEHEADGGGCPACRRKRLAWERAVRLGVYRDVLREAVLRAKFDRDRRMARDLGERLGEAIAACCEAGAVPPAEIALVPMPMSWRRRMDRRIDHSAAIARAAADACSGRFAQVLRRREGEQQSLLPGAARMRGPAGSMRLGARAARQLIGDEPPRVLVLIDDVRTTGATLKEGCRAVLAGLREAGLEIPRLWVATVAVTPDRRRGDGISSEAKAAEGALNGGQAGETA